MRKLCDKGCQVMTVIEKSKNEYLKAIHEYAKHHKIVIYGAGINGHRLFKLLSSEHVVVDSFAVTQSSLNVNAIQEIPVRDISWWQENDNEEYVFLIGVSGTNGSIIRAELEKHHISNVVDVPKYFDIFLDDWYFTPVLEITPLAGCAVNCKYCPQKPFLDSYYKRTSKREMSFEEFKTCIDKTPNDLNIDFSGFVEPFLSKDAVKMIQYSREKGRKIRLFTTLRGLTFDKYREIEDVDFDMVVLHLPDKMKYANIPITDEYLELLELFASRKKADRMPYVDLANCQAEPDERAVKIIKNRFPISWNLIDRAGNISSDDKLESSHEQKGCLFCGRAAGINHNVLLPNGDVVLCCMDFGMQHVLGNLLEGTYEDIVCSEEMRKIKYAMKHDGECLCRECTSALLQES